MAHQNLSLDEAVEAAVRQITPGAHGGTAAATPGGENISDPLGERQVRVAGTASGAPQRRQVTVFPARSDRA
jgi:hypothetical protein